jgi:hypothetical protein
MWYGDSEHSVGSTECHRGTHLARQMLVNNSNLSDVPFNTEASLHYT